MSIVTLWCQQSHQCFVNHFVVSVYLVSREVHLRCGLRGSHKLEQGRGGRWQLVVRLQLSFIFFFHYAPACFFFQCNFASVSVFSTIHCILFYHIAPALSAFWTFLVPSNIICPLYEVASWCQPIKAQHELMLTALAKVTLRASFVIPQRHRSQSVCILLKMMFFLR